jgi:hypothetical protein
MKATLKKIPMRRKAGTRPNAPHIPDWALQFMEANHQYASEDILADLHKLSKKQQREMVGHSVRLLQNESLKRKEKLRNGAVRLIVALLPATFPVLEKLLADFRSPLWHEIHFIAFSSLDRSDLKVTDQKRVLVLMEDYLMNVDSESGFAAWKAGDMLGDEWNSLETVQILERLVFAGRHVAGRIGALHGIAHAMDKATPSEEDRLLVLVRKTASKDRSTEVRSYASYILGGNSCYRGEGKRKKRRSGA